MERVDAGDYTVYIGNDAARVLDETVAGDHGASAFILVDSNTRQHCLPVLIESCPNLRTAKVFEVPPGESCKSPETLVALWNKLLDAGADRQGVLYACGGGAVCDLGGFAASTFHRGMRFHLVPTSLLAMVDASIGGKNGINLGHAKNQAGTFALPAAVFILPKFLQSLPARELRAGMAEVLKHIFLAEQLSLPTDGEMTPRTDGSWSRLIAESVAFKHAIVSEDLRDQGKRQLLNFGHTLGHAIESVSLRRDGDPLLHGEAVALGMLGELQLSRSYCGLAAEESAALIKRVLDLFGHLHWQAPIGELVDALARDKKRAGSVIRFSLLKAKGQGVTGVEVDTAQAADAFRFIFELTEGKRATA